MNAGVFYLVATLATWAGWLCAVRAAWLLGIIGLRLPGHDRGRTAGAALAASSLALAFLAASWLLPGSGSAKGAFGLPLVWVVMSAYGWLAVGCALLAGIRALQGITGVDPMARRAKWIAAGSWLSASIAGIVSQYLWGGEVVVLRGTLPLSGGILGAMGCLALLALALAAVVGRTSHARAYKGVAVHVVLLIGSAVFGLPLAWLLITSFKEDRDMASAEGVVWIPRVQVERPYLDPYEPLYRGVMNGRSVQGIVVARRPDGGSTVEVQRPLSMRGLTFEASPGELEQIPKLVPVVRGRIGSTPFVGMVVEERKDGSRRVMVLEPKALANRTRVFMSSELEPVRNPGLRWRNYTEALEYLPPETNDGLVYLKNTLLLVVMSVLGTVLSCAIVAYAFSRLSFPGRDALFKLMLSTMMLPAAVTLLPTFLIFRSLGWIDTLYPLWVPTFFAGAFNVFLLRQFLMGVPKELEDAAKIDGCSYLGTFWRVMLPQIKPALVVVAIWTFIGAWNNFMGPLIYISSPENMPISYALQLFQGERNTEPGLLMAFATMGMMPVLLLFFFAQRYFIEGAQLTGLGGR